MGDALYEALSPSIRTSRYASTRRSAALPTSCRTWCAGCWRTAPTPRSCTRSPTPACRSKIWSPIQSSSFPKPYVPTPRIPLPRDIYPDRKNSLGLDLARPRCARFPSPENHCRKAFPPPASTPRQVLDSALGRAAQSFESWSRVPRRERAAVLERAADMLEERMVDLVALIVREGGRTYADAVSEVREAADFCRYYASKQRAISSSTAARSRRREQRIATARPRRLRVHQPLELSALHLHRPGGRRACRGQCRHRQAGGADAADRFFSNEFVAPGRHSANAVIASQGMAKR